MKLRYAQKEVLKQITEAIDSGKRDIFIQAPTGVGKSLIALELSKMLALIGKDSYILTSEKSLQQQYEDDCKVKFAPRHEDVISISGIDTYKCNINNEKFSLGVCRNLGLSNKAALELTCSSNCEYLQRWYSAKMSKRVIMNYNLYLLQMNYVYPRMGKNAPFQRRNIVICDEAHKLPDIIESHFACRLNPNTANRILDVIKGLTSLGHNYNLNISELRTSISYAISKPEGVSASIHHAALKRVYDAYSTMISSLNCIKAELTVKYMPGSHSPEDLKEFSKNLPKEIKALLSLTDAIKDQHCKVEDAYNMIELHGLQNLVACDQEKGERSYHNLSDYHLFHKHFRNFSDVRIYMSATLQSNLLINRWKLDPKICHIIDVASDWDPNKSPVVCCNTTNMSHGGGASSVNAAIMKIDSLLNSHSSERGVIHTTTNIIAEELLANSIHANRLYSYSGTVEKIELLKRLPNLPKNAVIIGPSLFTGVDLYDDLARFNIIVKLGYPNVGSRVWKRRFDFQPDVYFGEAASVLEQSAGRTTRHKDDYSTTYILDDRAKNFISKNKRYFSESFLGRVL